MTFFVENRETILGVLTIIAFVLSTGQLISGIIKNRTNYSVELVNANMLELYERNQLTATFMIANKSSSPLTITLFEYLDEDNTYKCMLRKTVIAELHRPKYPETDIPITERVYSTVVPINLAPKEATICHIPFEMDKQKRIITIDSRMKFRITTSKGKKTIFLQPNDINKELKYY